MLFVPICFGVLAAIYIGLVIYLFRKKNPQAKSNFYMAISWVLIFISQLLVYLLEGKASNAMLTVLSVVLWICAFISLGLAIRENLRLNREKKDS
ncbi:MAG: hypothetical protein IJ230_08515 [Clostridia bacterium]|nr:hypothetical protein [Clostridia bacterium]